ncbi:MAG: hypothetical protein LBT00_10910 [Spirochaetaceae bacterium]|nr:hypothetical protein [Spirochaetaceae bacterium]
MWCGYPRWLLPAKQHPLKGGVLFGAVLPVGCRLLNSTRPKKACCLVWLSLPIAARSTVPAPRSVPFGAATPDGNRPLNSTRPKRTCYSVLSFRPGEHHRKAALLPKTATSGGNTPP